MAAYCNSCKIRKTGTNCPHCESCSSCCAQKKEKFSELGGRFVGHCCFNSSDGPRRVETARERREREKREAEEKVALIAERGDMTIGICHCHGQTWMYVPHATKSDPSTYICGTFDNEILAMLLGYYRGERAAKKD